MPDAHSNPALSAKPRQWTVVAAGLLLLALALVVLYTSPGALLSPVALVVVAAIGLAALLLQLRLRPELNRRVHAPLWLNVTGLVFAVAAVCADILRLSPRLLLIAALGAVIGFGTSGIIVLKALRKPR